MSKEQKELEVIEMGQPAEFALHEQVVSDINTLISQQRALQGQITLILQTVINTAGLDGNWTLAPDGMKLVKV